MLRGLVQASASALGGNRFRLLNVLPGVLVVAVIVVLVRAHAFDPRAPVEFKDVLPEKQDIGSAVLLALAALLGGILLRPFEIAMIQMLEGYWPMRAPIGSVAGMAKEKHRRRKETAEIKCDAKVVQGSAQVDGSLAYLVRNKQALTRASAVSQRAKDLLARYPVDDENVMPTMLGNVLRTGEETAGGRYGLDMMTVFPRMYPSLSDRLEKALSSQFDLISITSSLSISFGLLAIATCPLLARVDPLSLVPFGMALAAALFYRGSMKAASDHAILLATAFDLHRFDMLAALHYELPTKAQEEYELNVNLTAFLGGSTPLREMRLGRTDFVHPTPASGQDDSSAAP